MSLACSEEGYIKVFKCNPTYPYFNVADNHCYTSEEAAAQANEKADSDAGDAEENGKSENETDKTGNETDQSGSETDKTGNETDQSESETDKTGNETDQSGSETEEPVEDAGEGA